jgi:small neutral amino acid transporter SnatA (MarC family)
MRSGLIILFVAVNPPAVALTLWARVDRTVLAAGLAMTGALAVVLGLLSDPILDLLSVNPATFRVTAGAVLGLAAATWLSRGPRLLPLEDDLVTGEETRDAKRWSALIVPVLIPTLVTPQLVAASIAVGADEGVLPAAVGAIVALGLAGTAAVLVARGRPGVWSVGVRLVGLVGAVVALGMVVDGVKSV